MGRWKVSGRNDAFMKDDQPHFYFADTVWSVFSNATLEEWKEYLTYRRRQQFNVLQMSILPILHDASDTYVGIYPFKVKEDGSWDFFQINETFFDKAEKMVQMAYEHGMTCALVVLWANYVPGTIFSDQDAHFVMPYTAVDPYAAYVAERFKAYEPIYLISGDTNLDSTEANHYYGTALHTIKRADPHALTTLHLCGGKTLEAERWIQSEQLDFYMYQSCHYIETQQDAYRLAEAFAAKPIKRPIVNGEPAYEGHGYGNAYGRFDAFDVRKSFWWSVLSGAKAGFAYGAHGLFSWHKRGAGFTSESWSKMPFDWRTALRFQGAWDASFCVWLVNTYDLQKLEPAQHLLLTPYEHIRMAVAPDACKLAVYVPYSQDVDMALDLTDYVTEMILLSSRDIVRPEVHVHEKGTTFKMNDANGDVLIIAEKKMTYRCSCKYREG